MAQEFSTPNTVVMQLTSDDSIFQITYNSDEITELIQNPVKRLRKNLNDRDFRALGSPDVTILFSFSDATPTDQDIFLVEGTIATNVLTVRARRTPADGGGRLNFLRSFRNTFVKDRLQQNGLQQNELRLLMNETEPADTAEATTESTNVKAATQLTKEQLTEKFSEQLAKFNEEAMEESLIKKDTPIHFRRIPNTGEFYAHYQLGDDLATARTRIANFVLHPQELIDQMNKQSQEETQDPALISGVGSKGVSTSATSARKVVFALPKPSSPSNLTEASYKSISAQSSADLNTSVPNTLLEVRFLYQWLDETVGDRPQSIEDSDLCSCNKTRAVEIPNPDNPDETIAVIDTIVSTTYIPCPTDPADPPPPDPGSAPEPTIEPTSEVA